ncbi:MAG: hypothetical protein JSR91_04950 [Proteobacteria bacterium]|nr:hypothetical protein [Pseudomonadota bacterium]
MSLHLIAQGAAPQGAEPRTAPSSSMDIHLFLRGLLLAQRRGLRPDEVRNVAASWTLARETPGEAQVAAGFILDMDRHERLYLEYDRHEMDEGMRERVNVESLPPDTLYPLPSSCLPPVQWSTAVGHLNRRLPRMSWPPED